MGMPDYSPVIAPEFVSPLYKELAQIDLESLSPIFKRKGLAVVTGGQGHVVSSESLADALKGFTVTVWAWPCAV